MTVLLTGASGFLGRGIHSVAQRRHIEMRCVFRSITSADGCADAVLMAGLDGTTNWRASLQGIDVVIHAAARAHVMCDESLDPLTEYRSVNVLGTLNLARQAADVGVRRFVFISSIKVNGESTIPGHPFTADDAPAPEDAYGISKAEAESELRQLAEESGMEVVIIRPPLVYGPRVKGNFSSLLRAVTSGLPLPFGSLTKNRRSLVALDNLVDLILTCVDHPNAANQIFLVSDGEDLSIVELLQRLGKALNRPARLLRVPTGFLTLAACFFGKMVIVKRLMGSLQVDISKTVTLLEWKPLVSVDEGLRKMAEHKL